MSVEPGKGGQSFIENSNERMKGIVSMAKGLNKKLIKEIDGGINKDTSIIALSSGADLLVAGSFLFGHSDFKSRLLSLTKGK
jgi:ribulose-phosphate 3-epimerase